MSHKTQIEKTPEIPEDGEGNEVDILFPDHNLILDTGEVITISPVSMLHIKKVFNSFKHLLEVYKKLSEQGKSQEEILADIAYHCLDEILSLVPVCLKNEITGQSGNDVLATIGPKDIPRVIAIIVKQNFHPDVLGNWKALFAEVTGLLPKDLMQVAQKPLKDAKQEGSKV